MRIRTKLLFELLLFFCALNVLISSGFAQEQLPKKENVRSVLIKEKKVRPIVTNIDSLPISKKTGDYFAVRSSTPDSLMVQFGIQAPQKEEVSVRLLQNDKEIRRIKVQGRCGRIVFSGLTPKTNYTAVATWFECVNKMTQPTVYSVKTKRIPCRTADKPNGTPLLKLAIVSDTHVSIITKPGGRLHCKSAEILKNVCQTANSRKSAVMIIVGDITDANLPEEYQQAKDSVSTFRGKLLPVPGNHDDRTPEPEIWRSHFGRDAGLEIINGIQFLWLNTANARLNKPANLAAIEQLNTNIPAVIFSHMQLVPDEYLNDKGKVIRDAEEVRAQLDKIGRSKAIIYIGHKNVATTAALGQATQMNVPQTTQFPAGWLEAEIYPEGIYHQFVPSCPTELEELSRLLGGDMMKGIGYRDVYSFDLWNQFIPWPILSPDVLHKTKID